MKKLISVLASITLSLSLCSCGNTDSSSDVTTTTTTTTAATTTTTTTVQQSQTTTTTTTQSETTPSETTTTTVTETEPTKTTTEKTTTAKTTTTKVTTTKPKTTTTKVTTTTKKSETTTKAQGQWDGTGYKGDYSELRGTYTNSTSSYFFHLIDSDKESITFTLEYVGPNASYIIYTEEITVYMYEGNSARFSWEDSWGCTGVGDLSIYAGSEPYIDLLVLCEYEAPGIRNTLDTGEGLKLYPLN